MLLQQKMEPLLIEAHVGPGNKIALEGEQPPGRALARKRTRTEKDTMARAKNILNYL